MATPFDHIVADAMKLPAKDRVRLALQLVSSLDEQVEPNAEALWLAEAERRLDELRTGAVQGVDAADAFSAARRALRR